MSSSEKFFTITILLLSGSDANKKLINAVKKTINRKLNYKNKKKTIELKGSATTFEIKKYFYKQVKNIKFNIFSISLSKQCLSGTKTSKDKERVYNFIAKKVVDKIFSYNKFNNNRIQFTIDKSKGKPGIEEFNKYIRNHLTATVSPNILINIDHLDSSEQKGIQACDLFAYGIFQKYERGKNNWYDLFKEKVAYDETYP